MSWDIAWHAAVGRDTLWIPPHIAILSNLALTGALCIGLVLWETWRFQGVSGSGVDTTDLDTTLDQVAVLGVLRAPLGVIVAGFGALTGALSVPLDDYWHSMYGIDVGLWAPFHMMGILGGIIRDLGCLYVWADLLRVDRGARGRETGARPVLAGLMCTAALLLVRLLLLTTPGIVRVPTIELGSMQVMTYPVLLALLLPWVLVAITRTIGAHWSSSIVGGLLFGYAVVVGFSIPWAIRAAVAIQGWPLRLPESVAAKLGLILVGSMSTLALLVLPVAVLTDVLNRPRANQEARSALTNGAATGLVLWLLGTALALAVHVAAGRMRTAGPFSGVGFASTPAAASASLTAVALALPAALVAGALSGLVGDGLARALRRGPR